MTLCWTACGPARVLALVLAASASFGCASTRRWGGLAAHDLEAIIRSPANIEQRTWKRTALTAGAVAASLALDEAVRDGARKNVSNAGGELSAVIGPFGGRYSDRVMAGFLFFGVAAKNDRAKAVAFDSFVSSLLASKVFTPALKQIAGRDRPNAANGAFEFDGGSSFPSNHATQAFVVASVIASHYESRWVDAAAYSLATLVGVSRIYDDAHWLSDTVAGAAIGTATGRFISGTNRHRRASWSISPIVDARLRGVSIAWRPGRSHSKSQLLERSAASGGRD